MSNINIKIIPQTEEEKTSRPMTNDEYEKYLYQKYGDTYRIDKDGKWNLTKFDSTKIEDTEFSFKLQIKSDFPPSR